ncbi:hypothetical protein V6V47_01985 [Micromonospora sp. CPCC 205539]|uniref:hypothetical protein n=1 Tax=Micromonospora sp. CPCC 205539 TaxID=3122408 RepID=UPI002FF2326C
MSQPLPGGDSQRNPGDLSIRSDVAALDVVMALGGISLITGEPDQRAQAARQLDLLRYALRPLPSDPAAGLR